jgi:hypothetical protein
LKVDHKMAKGTHEIIKSSNANLGVGPQNTQPRTEQAHSNQHRQLAQPNQLTKDAVASVHAESAQLQTSAIRPIRHSTERCIFEPNKKVKEPSSGVGKEQSEIDVHPHDSHQQSGC